MVGMAYIDIYKSPAMAPPPGEVSNLMNPYSRATDFIVTIVLCLLVSAVGCAMRIFTKAYVMRQMRVEDYSLILAELFFAAYAAITLRCLNFGKGRHLWDVSIANAQEFANVNHVPFVTRVTGSFEKLGNIGEIIYSPTMFLAKLSVLKQLERIFVGTKKDHIYWWIQAMIWVNAAFYLSIIIVFICACIPREKLWNPLIDGTCIDTGVSILATSGINIISDWSILILPALIIRRLHMGSRQKIGIVAYFSVGLLACMASIVRLVYSVQFTQTADQTWAITAVSIWSYVEVATVILSGCFPIIPKFVQFVRFGQGRPKTSNSTSISTRLKSNLSSRKTGYLLRDDLYSQTDPNFNDFNISMENGKHENMELSDQNIRKTVTMKAKNNMPRPMSKDGDPGQRYPWDSSV